MKEIVQYVHNFLNDHQIDLNSKLLLACSGGLDSMVLLSVLVELGYKPDIAHCNFKLRGDDSDQDEQFVKAFAEKHSLKFYTKSFETKKYADSHGLSIQMAARDLRYQYFREIMESEEQQFLVLAHHADDSLETILMNLGRGTGLMALSGIKPDRANVLRPMWLFSKHDISEFAIDNRIKWREDLSNLKDDYQRNFIRHHIIQPLKEAFPEFSISFSKTLARTYNDRLLFEHLIAEKLDQLVTRESDKEKFPLMTLKSQPELMGLLFYWLQPHGNFDLTAIYQSIEKGEPGKLFDSNNARLLLDRDYLILHTKENLRWKEYLIDADVNYIATPFEMNLNKVDSEGFELNRPSTEAALDFNKLNFPLKLRRWKEGDSFVPLGMNGKKKLSDFFTDQKINRFEKDDTWLLCSGDEICWVVGHRIDDRFKVTDTTKSIYFVRLN